MKRALPKKESAAMVHKTEGHECLGDKCEMRQIAIKALEIEERIKPLRTTFEDGKESDSAGIYLEHATD